MSDLKKELAEFMVLSRGQWDKHLAPADIQSAIDSFYAWHERLVTEGVMHSGQRLARDCVLVSRNGNIDGPFSEAKEFVGGYWFIRAGSLQEAAAIAAQNPCMACGLSYEIRPIEAVKASAFETTCETPGE